MVVNTIWFDIKVKCCKGNTKASHPTKKVYNLYTNICPLPVCLHVKECMCFYCHLTLFVRNKLIYRDFKSVRWFQSILHAPAHILHTPLPCSRFGRMRRVVRHRDVEKSVGATDFSAPLCRDIALPCLCRVAVYGVCMLCRLCVGGFSNILHWEKYW